MKCALLHGFAGDPAAWDAVIAYLPSAIEARAIALPGHGGGPVRETWADNIAVVGESLVGCDAVAGYSFGARVALGVLATGANLRAVLIGCNPGIADRERPARVATDAHWAALLRTRGIAEFTDAWSTQPLFASQRQVAAERLTARRVRRLALDPMQLARCLDVMGTGAMPDYRPALPALAHRIAWLAGAGDATYAQLAQSLPGAHRALIADCGHDPTLEQPAALAAAIGVALEALA